MNTIANKYTLLHIIGEGNFGKIYKGENTKNGELVAIKMEHPETTLKHETKILNYLYSKGCRNIPPVYWYGKYNLYHCLVIPMYDISIYDYIKQKKINEENLKKIMFKIIEIFQNIHEFFVIHRDIKPQNILFYENDVYLIDFGLSTFFVDENGEHLKNIAKKCIIGTTKYISHNIHIGNTASRRDDLISLGFIYLYLLQGSLPWENIELLTEEEITEMYITNTTNIKRGELKQWILVEPHCKKYGQHFTNYMKYCYALKYADKPNYDYLKNLF